MSCSCEKGEIRQYSSCDNSFCCISCSCIYKCYYTNASSSCRGVKFLEETTKKWGGIVRMVPKVASWLYLIMYAASSRYVHNWRLFWNSSLYVTESPTASAERDWLTLMTLFPEKGSFKLWLRRKMSRWDNDVLVVKTSTSTIDHIDSTIVTELNLKTLHHDLWKDSASWSGSKAYWFSRTTVMGPITTARNKYNKAKNAHLAQPLQAHWWL